jgi:hypothetical protein
VENQQLVFVDSHGEAACALGQINASREVGLRVWHLGKRLADELGRLLGREL